jgi:hypothetical protein
MMGKAIQSVQYISIDCLYKNTPPLTLLPGFGCDVCPVSGIANKTKASALKSMFFILFTLFSFLHPDFGTVPLELRHRPARRPTTKSVCTPRFPMQRFPGYFRSFFGINMVHLEALGGPLHFLQGSGGLPLATFDIAIICLPFGCFSIIASQEGAFEYFC